MARKRKRYTARGRATEAKRKNKNNLDISVIVIMIFSVLLAAILYTNSGEIGQKLNEILGGLIGILRFILPIGTFAIAIKIASEHEEDYITGKLLQYAVLLICLAIIFSVYEISTGNIEVSGNLSQNIKKSYELGALNKGGGAIGTVAAIFLVKMLGNLGAVILSIGVSILIFAFIWGIDLSEYLSKSIEGHIERKEEQKIEREEYRRKRAEMIAQRRKEQQELEQETKERKINEISAIQDMQEAEQIKINLNGRVIDSNENEKGFKKFFKKQRREEKESTTDTANSIMQIDEETGEIFEPNSTLFVQEEEQKQDKTKQVLQLEHTISVEDDNYVFPPLDILSEMEKSSLKGGTKSLTNTAAKLQKTLYSFGVSAKVENVTVGPAITRYELKPAEGVRVSKIANLADDIALNLAAETIRIEAPIPGKQAVGIEVPNTQKEMVGLKEVLESEEFKSNDSKLSVALGKDVAGSPVVADISKMPHVLIAGSTGSR